MSLGERLIVARHRQFAGCAAELASFQAALSAPEVSFQITSVLSAGRVDKTTFLHEFARLSKAAQARLF